MRSAPIAVRGWQVPRMGEHAIVVGDNVVAKVRAGNRERPCRPLRVAQGAASRRILLRRSRPARTRGGPVERMLWSEVSHLAQ
jgi:hypothetical protein